MLALISAWLGLISMSLALGMVAYRPLFDDRLVPIVLYSASGAMALAGISLWSLRKEDREADGVSARRLQCIVGIATGLFGAALIYALVIGAERVSPQASPLGNHLLDFASSSTVGAPNAWQTPGCGVA